MRKATKIWLVSAALLIVLGITAFAGVMTSCGWDFSKLSTVEYQTNTYEITDSFNSILVDVDTADVAFIASTDGKCKVVCRENANDTHRVAVENSTLSVTNPTDVQKWYEYININIGSPLIEIYLTDEHYDSMYARTSTGDVGVGESVKFGDVEIKVSTGNVYCRTPEANNIKISVSTGNIHISNVKAESISASASTGNTALTQVSCSSDIMMSATTGDVEMADVSCKNLTSTGSTGEIEAERLIVTGKITVERSAGDVTLDESDAGEIYIETKTGDVECEFLTDKSITATTSTGNVEIPRDSVGGKCEIKTSTGDIEVEVLRK